jgi:hypothetical protein
MGILNNDNDNLDDATNGNQCGGGGGDGATTKLII